eukprot:9477765-Pyramimonas_sp.AAC.3
MEGLNYASPRRKPKYRLWGPSRGVPGAPLGVLGAVSVPSCPSWSSLGPSWSRRRPQEPIGSQRARKHAACVSLQV